MAPDTSEAKGARRLPWLAQHQCDCNMGGVTPLEWALAHPWEASIGGMGALGLVVVGGVYLAWRVGWLARLVAWPAWTRLRRTELASHPKRAALLDAIRARPGVTTANLVAATALNQGTALHHLRALENASLVKSLLVGRDRTWFEAAARPPQGEALAAMQAPMRAAILDALRHEPGLTQAELARRLGSSRNNLHHHVTVLRDAGLVVVREEDGAARCYAADAAPALRR